MKKALFVLLSLLILFSFVSCSPNAKGNDLDGGYRKDFALTIVNKTSLTLTITVVDSECSVYAEDMDIHEGKSWSTDPLHGMKSLTVSWTGGIYDYKSRSFDISSSRTITFTDDGLEL